MSATHAPPPHERARIDFIQALRGVAALAVVVLHAGWDHADYGDAQSVRHALSAGIAGVDLFFVISGFIMYCTLPIGVSASSEAWSFAARRLCRIWPPYAVWTMAIVMIAAWLPASHPFLGTTTLADLPKSLLFVPTSLHFFAPSFTLPLLDVGWTLNYEMYFYSVLFACLCFGRWRRVAFVSWLILAMLLVPLLRGRLSLDSDMPGTGASPLLDTLTNPIMWEFVIGMAIAHVYQQGLRFRHAAAGWTMTMLALLALLVYCVRVPQIHHGLTGVGVPIGLMVLALAMTPDHATLNWRPLCWLGKISFSLYLAHKPLIIAAETLLSLRFVPLRPLALTGWILIATLASVLLATLSFRWLEVALSGGLRRLLAKHSTTGLAAAGQTSARG